MTPRILVFAGSTRSGAYSGKTADVAQRELALGGAEVTRISLADYPLPIMDEDLEREKGVPENAVRLARLFAAHDGILIATPEYNGSMPPLPGRLVAICSSSDGHFAGIRSAGHLRAVLSHIQMEVISPQCSIPYGKEAFDEDGNFREERHAKSMKRVCESLIGMARTLSRRAEG
jgi:NAD(P)H-dependent FMN reductase